MLKVAMGLSRSLHALNTPAPIHLLLQRAVVFRAYRDFLDRCPDTVYFLVRAARPVIEQLPTTSGEGLLGFFRSSDPGRTPSPSVLETVFGRVVAQRGLVEPQKPAHPTPLPGPAELKAHFRKYLEELRRGPERADLRSFVLLGALAELMARSRLSPAVIERLHAAEAAGKENGGTPSGAAALLLALEGLVQ